MSSSDSAEWNDPPGVDENGDEDVAVEEDEDRDTFGIELIIVGIFMLAVLAVAEVFTTPMRIWFSYPAILIICGAVIYGVLNR